MKKILLVSLVAVLGYSQSAFANRAFFLNGLNCAVVGSNIGNITKVRLYHPIEKFREFSVMDISFKDGSYAIYKAFRGGIENTTNTPFAETTVFEHNVGMRSLITVFSYAVKSKFDTENPRRRGGYTGMRAKLLLPLEQDELEVLCEPFFN